MRPSAIAPCLVLLCGLAAATRAQDPAPSPSPSPLPRHSEYVEVTATRIPEPADEVPASIEVIAGEDLRAWGATDLRGALSLAAGVDLAPGGDGGPAASVPEFWGLKEFDAFLLVVDGVPWGGAFNPALASLDLHDVERIEVLRGPAPVMYGATSFVGVVQVVHKGGGASKGSVTATGGSYGSAGASGVAPFHWGGFDSTFSADAGRLGFKDDRTAVRRGHALWRNERSLSGDSRFRFNVDGTWLDQDPASPRIREGRTLSPLNPVDANYNPDGAFLNERRFAISAGLDRPLGNATWSSQASFTHSSQDILRGFLAEVAEPDAEARGIREKIDVNDLYVDTHLEWTKSARFKVVAGLDHLFAKGDAEGADFDYEVLTNGSTATVVTAPTVLDVDIRDTRNFSGLYGFVEWNPSDKWSIEAGARLNRTSEERGEGEEESSASEPKTEHTKLSGSAGVSWKAWQRGSDRLLLFVSYRDTFKPAAIDFGIEEGEEEGEGILEPETARSYEIGARVRGFDGRASLEVSAFQMDFKNLVISQAINGLPSLANAGSERFKGFEAALALRFANHVSARATYSFHDAKFEDFLTEFDGVPTQLAGKRLEMSARHLASAGLLYSPTDGFFGGVSLNWVGSRFLNKRNTAPTDAYATFSAALGYRSGRWEFRVDGRNLNDARAAIAESELGDAQYYLLPARRVDLSASLRF